MRRIESPSALSFRKTKNLVYSTLSHACETGEPSLCLCVSFMLKVSKHGKPIQGKNRSMQFAAFWGGLIYPTEVVAIPY